MKVEQPLAIKIAEIINEAKDVKTFWFNHKIEAKPGQFVLLWIPQLDQKPFGISYLTENSFAVTVCKVGPFTEKLFNKKVGDYVGIQGPYGKPFSTNKNNVILVAGGYGAAPLSFLAEVLEKEGANVTFIIGAKTNECLVYKSRFPNLVCTTDDGSCGRKGFTTDVLKEVLKEDLTIDFVYSCGPEIMMQKVIELTDQYNVPCEVSLERYMKCGFGLCGQCCVDGSGVRVCQEGPIFTKEYVKEHLTEFNQYKRDKSGSKVYFFPPQRIDPHVHFRDEEQKHKETIAHGLQVAKEQGVNMVFDMPNTAKPVLRKEDVQRRLALVPESEKGRYFLYVGATTDPEQLDEAVSLVKNVTEVIGLKMYAGRSTGDLAIIDEEHQRMVYRVLVQNNYTGVLAVHCEKEIYFQNTFNPDNPLTHTLARPKIAEIESIKDQIRLMKETNFQGTLHICHVSCQESIEIIDQARKEIKITCGVTPHHLLWDESKLNELNGLLYKMNPPLRSKEDVAALREFLRQGKIDWLETDHAPHTYDEKMFLDHPSGYPSLELYKKCVEELLPSLGLTKQQIEDLTYHNIVKTYFS